MHPAWFVFLAAMLATLLLSMSFALKQDRRDAEQSWRDSIETRLEQLENNE